MSALVTIPVFMREPVDFDVTLQTIESIRRTEPNVPLLLVDDHSPVRGLVDELETHAERLAFEIHRKEENSGFSRTVNIGLQRALEEGRDCVLLNADMECLTADWIGVMERQKDTQGRPAAMVGALLVYPNGLIQHAGIYFSFLTRTFDHRYRFGPMGLPEANVAACCPVTGAFQFIRHSTLRTIGTYDSEFQMAYEDVDFCLRVFDVGLECIYQPRVKAIHHESLFRGRADAKINEWQSASLRRLMEKHGRTHMGRFVPEIV